MSLLSRPPRALLLLLLLGIALLTLLPLSPPFLSRSDPLSSKTPNAEVPTSPLDRDIASLPSRTLSIPTLLEVAYRTLRSTSEAYDPHPLTSEWGLSLGSLSLDAYSAELVSTFQEFFTPPATDSTSSSSPSSSSPLLEEILGHLSLLPRKHEQLPKRIYTTDLRSPVDTPWQFKSWATENRDWEVVFVQDQGMEEWLDEALGGAGTGVVTELRELMGGPHGVVRADLFRYLVLLLSGGVYTDTDTACVRPLSDWPSPSPSTTQPLLAALPQLLELASVPPVSGEATVDSLPDDSATVSEDSPSLIVALEVDARKDGVDWRAESFVRGLQIAQWTLVGEKAHPVMLDVLGRGLRQAKRIREEGGEAGDVLEWSGPGPFTDAVLRYLLVRHGIRPDQLSGLDNPVRFGDVLVMPVHSFRADASEGYQGENTLVWHGFFGRWKGERR